MDTLHSCSFSSLRFPSARIPKYSRPQRRIHCQSSNDNNEGYFLDASVSVGDGFSFSGGESSSCLWFWGESKEYHFWTYNGSEFAGGIGSFQGYPLTMILCNRWFCVKSGNSNNSTILLIHGLPSQAYSYCKVLSILENNYYAIALDWLEYVASMESVINALTDKKGYFSPIAIKYTSNHLEKSNGLILLDPPLTMKHVNLPSSLSVLSNSLLGEIFSQDPIRASDKTLLSCGPYQIKEDVAMVYRRPYLTFGSAGFALNAISKAMKKQFKGYVEHTRAILMDNNWSVQTTVF